MKGVEDRFLGKAASLLPIFLDPEVTDILVNGRESLYVERKGILERHNSPFDEQSLSDFIERLLIPLGKRIDAREPFLDGRIGEDARFHILLPPLVSGGAHISIRKSRKSEWASLESFGDTAPLLEKFEAKENILVCGPTGSGKTTLLTRLLETVDPLERLLILEESREISISHPHCVRLETLPPGPDRSFGIGLSELVRNALRMRPDRLVIGECRGGEALQLLLALQTGHRGSVTTLHAGSCREALRRLEALVLSSGTMMPLSVIREGISTAIGFIVRVEKVGDQRLIVETAEVSGLEGEVYRLA